MRFRGPSQSGKQSLLRAWHEQRDTHVSARDVVPARVCENAPQISTQGYRKLVALSMIGYLLFGIIRPDVRQALVQNVRPLNESNYQVKSKLRQWIASRLPGRTRFCVPKTSPIKGTAVRPRSPAVLSPVACRRSFERLSPFDNVITQLWTEPRARWPADGSTGDSAAAIRTSVNTQPPQRPLASTDHSRTQSLDYRHSRYPVQRHECYGTLPNIIKELQSIC
jgi:hypothetical protein